MSEIQSTPNIPLLPEDQSRLDTLVDELVTASDDELFVLDVPTALWIREAVTEEQFQVALTQAQANHPEASDLSRWAVDLGDGTVLDTQTGGTAHPADLPFDVVRFSDPVPAPTPEAGDLAA